MSKIEWTDRTWNPVTGCTKVSPGCKHCYAETMAARLKRMGVKGYQNGFDVTMHSSRLFDPYRWRKPVKIFVCSMADLFHDDVPFDFIDRVMTVAHNCQRHVFQVLTKRVFRMYLYFQNREVPPNVWIGTSVETRRFAQPRIDYLCSISHAPVRFLSIEPLLQDLGKLYLYNHIHWVICGGESGPGARPIKREWVVDIRDQCIKENIPFFFKQWGGTNKKQTGRLLDGRTWDEFPRLRAGGEDR